MFVIAALERLRQEDSDFKTSLGSIDKQTKSFFKNNLSMV